MLDLDFKKYDRQIRHFGKEVQIKLSTVTINIQSNDPNSLISGEILKNLVLLGVNNLHYDDNTYKSYKKLVPNEIYQINSNVQFCKLEEYDYNFIIYKCSNNETIEKNVVYICTDHYTFKKCKTPCNTDKIDKDIIKDCLLGGIITQEFIKKLQGNFFLDFYTLVI